MYLIVYLTEKKIHPLCKILAALLSDVACLVWFGDMNGFVKYINKMYSSVQKAKLAAADDLVPTGNLQTTPNTHTWTSITS